MNTYFLLGRESRVPLSKTQLGSFDWDAPGGKADRRYSKSSDKGSRKSSMIPQEAEKIRGTSAFQTFWCPQINQRLFRIINGDRYVLNYFRTNSFILTCTKGRRASAFHLPSSRTDKATSSKGSDATTSTNHRNAGGPEPTRTSSKKRATSGCENDAQVTGIITIKITTTKVHRRRKRKPAGSKCRREGSLPLSTKTIRSNSIQVTFPKQVKQ